MPSVQARAVRRAAEVSGGVAVLAARLHVGGENLRKWLEGELPVPQDIFLRCVDIVSAHDEARDRAAKMLERVDMLERLLRPPLRRHQVESADRLIVIVAREAHSGRIANLAMRLMTAVHESKEGDEVAAGVQAALARLRTAVEENQSS